MIPYKNRFHKRGSIKFVYAKGEIHRSRHVTLKFVANQRTKAPRIAVVISKKTLKSAVRRNLVRRRLYGYINTRLKDLTGIHDIVLIVTSPEIISLTPVELRETIDSLFSEAGLYKKP